MKRGDHIRIQTGGGWEHAIDVGDRTVIHFSEGGGVKRSLLSALSPDSAPVEVVTHRERVYPPRQVVARAFSRFAESAYRSMFSSSEAFASWCKAGRMDPAACSGALPQPNGAAAQGAAEPGARVRVARPASKAKAKAKAKPQRAAPKKAAPKAPAKKKAAPARPAKKAKAPPPKPARAAKAKVVAVKARKARRSGKAAKDVPARQRGKPAGGGKARKAGKPAVRRSAARARRR